jgi:hypothetical protein
MPAPALKYNQLSSPHTSPRASQARVTSATGPPETATLLIRVPETKASALPSGEKAGYAAPPGPFEGSHREAAERAYDELLVLAQGEELAVRRDGEGRKREQAANRSGR